MFQLGHHVKIRKNMKHRQFKQVVEAGWNEQLKAVCFLVFYSSHIIL